MVLCMVHVIRHCCILTNKLNKSSISGLSSLRSSCFGSLGHQGSLSHNTGSLGHVQGPFGHGSLAHQKPLKDEMDGDVSPDSEGEKLRNDLLMAADSVTNAMSSLVRELNSGRFFTASESLCVVCFLLASVKGFI